MVTTGVATFFVISGFLITSNTLKRFGELGRVDIGKFYAIRVARILPTLLLFFTIMIPLAYSGSILFTPHSKSALWGSVYAILTFQFNSFFLTNQGEGLWHWSPLWSLSIEEMFYLTFPIACYLARKRSVLIALLTALIIGGPFARDNLAGIFNFWGAADLLALGCLAAIITAKFHRQLSIISGPLRWIGSILILFIFGFCKLQQHISLTPTILGLGAAMFLIGAASTDKMPRVTGIVGIVAGFGRLSYEIYIFHLALLLVLRAPCMKLMESIVGLDFANFTTTIILLSLVYLFSSLISQFFTNPMNVRIRRFYFTKVSESVGAD